MLKNKTTGIIKIVLSLLLLLLCCSKNEAEKKIYKTAIGVPSLGMHPEPKNTFRDNVIMAIPFKSKVEVIDNKSINNRVKIKYKDIIGYAHESYLSEKDDMPFIDDIKYNLSIHEFDYDKMSLMKDVKKYMYSSDYFYKDISYFYTENPQMFSLYGKDCNDMEIKIVAVIMNSKIVRFDSRMLCFEIKNNEFIFYASFPVETQSEILIEKRLEYQIRNPQDCG